MEVFARAIALETNLVSLRAAIASRLREITSCEAVVLCDYVQSRHQYEAVSSTDSPGEPVRLQPLDARGFLAKWLRVNLEPLVVPDATRVLDYLPERERDWLVSAGIRVCQPLVSGHRLAGVLLLLDRRETWQPAPGVIVSLKACAEHAAIACERVALAQAEGDRREAAYRAQQLAVTGQLAASVAHEVRNPLAAIRSNVQYVVEADPDQRGHDMLLRVIDEVDRINRVLSGLLGLSRPHELELTDLDFVEVCEQSLALMHGYLKGRHITIGRQFACRPLPVRGDADELRQVFLNVLLNAYQATPEFGSISMTSGMSPTNTLGTETDGILATLTIADTGPGISEDRLSHIFEPFYSTKKAGTGLGLPICLQIMNRHGGQIRVESQVGRGTTVILTLPLRTVPWPTSS